MERKITSALLIGLLNLSGIYVIAQSDNKDYVFAAAPFAQNTGWYKYTLNRYSLNDAVKF